MRVARSNPEPYIDPKLQQGTTPLVKVMNGQLTRSFRNFRHPKVVDEDFGGPKAILDNRFKLVVDAGTTGAGNEPSRELFDVRSDPGEGKNRIGDQKEIAQKLEGQLRDWQQSVLTSLTGADYK